MTIDIKAPLTWNELSLSDLKHVAYVMLLPELDRTHSSILLFCKLAGIKMKKNIAGSVFFKKGKLKFILEPYQLMDFSQRFNYIFDEKPCDIVNPTKIDPHLIDVKFGDYYFANVRRRARPTFRRGKRGAQSICCSSRSMWRGHSADVP